MPPIYRLRNLPSSAHSSLKPRVDCASQVSLAYLLNNPLHILVSLLNSAPVPTFIMTPLHFSSWGKNLEIFSDSSLSLTSNTLTPPIKSRRVVSFVFRAFAELYHLSPPALPDFH